MPLAVFVDWGTTNVCGWQNQLQHPCHYPHLRLWVLAHHPLPHLQRHQRQRPQRQLHQLYQQHRQQTDQPHQRAAMKRLMMGRWDRELWIKPVAPPSAPFSSWMITLTPGIHEWFGNTHPTNQWPVTHYMHTLHVSLIVRYLQQSEVPNKNQFGCHYYWLVFWLKVETILHKSNTAGQ